MSLADKLASFGQLTTIFLLLAPFPQFVFCHKKSLEMNASIKSISFKYLLANFFCYQVWLAYSVKAENTDLIVINGLGSIITTFFLLLFLYVKFRLNQYITPLLSIMVTIPVILACASKSLTTLTQTGLIATTLSVATYITCLDTVQLTLRTRDSETVNMGLTVASLVNGSIWMSYAILVRDIYVFIPNSCAILIAGINLNLYQWTQGKMDNHHWFILYLQNKFNVKGNKALRVIQSKISGGANSSSAGSEGSTLKRKQTRLAAKQKKFDELPSPKGNENISGKTFCSTDLVHGDQTQQTSAVVNRKNLSTQLFEFANEVAHSSKTFIISTINGSQDTQENHKNYQIVGSVNYNNGDQTPDSADFDIQCDDKEIRMSGFDLGDDTDLENKGASNDFIGAHLAYDQYPYVPGVDTLIGSKDCIVKGSRQEENEKV